MIGKVMASLLGAIFICAGLWIGYVSFVMAYEEAQIMRGLTFSEHNSWQTN